MKGRLRPTFGAWVGFVCLSPFPSVSTQTWKCTQRGDGQCSQARGRLTKSRSNGEVRKGSAISGKAGAEKRELALSHDDRIPVLRAETKKKSLGFLRSKIISEKTYQDR